MSAPSMIIRYEDDFVGDILSQDVMVPSSGLTVNTYYCTLGWNTGQEGGGYCGIQNAPRGRNFIFSLWDPKASRTPIKATSLGHGTEVSRFGGEGTGLRSLNYALGWQPDRWYTLMVRRRDSNNHTIFDFWATDKTTSKTTHLVTMEYPVAGVYFRGKTFSFMEDWAGTGHLARSVYYGNGAKHRQGGQWSYHTRAHFQLNATTSGTYKNAFDAEVKNGHYFLQAGNGTVPRNGSHDGMLLVQHKKREEEPELEQKPFTLTKVSPQEVTWDIPETNLPQYQYTVKVDGATAISEVDFHKRQYQLEIPAKETIEVEIEDLFGNITSRLHRFVDAGAEGGINN